jgi:chaperone required for assembly of F1-ATPase
MKAMREDLIKDLLPRHGEDIDPVAMARRDLTKSLPKRFYSEAGVVEVEGGFAPALDGKTTRTPARNALTLPTRALAEAVAAEWAAQVGVINPGTMPLTRLANSAIDGVSREADAVRAEIAKYAGSDLLCYRAGEPKSLVSAQAAEWDPVLDWARDALGARFVLSEGVMFVDQPNASIDAIRRAVADVNCHHALAALSSITTLTGSILLALAVLRGRLTADEAWRAAHVDEDFQMRAWGEDADAMARRARRWREMDAAATVLALSGN